MSAPPDASGRPGERSGTLERGLRLLQFFAAAGEATPAEAAKATGLSRSATYRIADRLRGWGFLELTATEGEGLQQMLGRTGDPAGWMAVASANGIENPRMLAPGTFVDLAAGRSATASVSATVRR